MSAVDIWLMVVNRVCRRCNFSTRFPLPLLITALTTAEDERSEAFDTGSASRSPAKFLGE